MAKPKRSTKKTTDKASKVTTTATTSTKETATNEPVAIKPMVPRSAPLSALSVAATTQATPEAKEPVVSKELVIQCFGKEISCNDVMNRAKQAYVEAGNTDEITSINTYVKPEESKVYFVINGKEGSFDY